MVNHIVERTVQPGDTVLDPACGAGAFLSAALRITARVTGIDCDEAALSIAARNAPGATLIHADALTCRAEPVDVIIGNPPFLSIDNYGLNTAELRERFDDIYRDKTDLAYYFLARAVELAKRTVGFVLPRAFLEAYKADKLRRYLSARTRIRELVDFGTERMFAGASVTTCIVILDKAEGSPSSAPWVIVPDPVRALNEKIDAAGTPLGEILEVGQGMQTGCNRAFTRSTPELCRKRARNSDIGKDNIRDRGEFVLYLEDVPSFDQLPPEIQDHLRFFEQPLRARAAHRRGDCEWWKYTWPLHKHLYNRERILCPYLAPENRFALAGDFLGLSDTTVLFDNGQPEDLRYILALLNSRLLNFRFRSIGKVKTAGMREYFWNTVSRLPIRRIDPGDPRHNLIAATGNESLIAELYNLSSAELRVVN